MNSLHNVYLQHNYTAFFLICQSIKFSFTQIFKMLCKVNQLTITITYQCIIAHFNVPSQPRKSRFLFKEAFLYIIITTKEGDTQHPQPHIPKQPQHIF